MIHFVTAGIQEVKELIKVIDTEYDILRVGEDVLIPFSNFDFKFL